MPYYIYWPTSYSPMFYRVDADDKRGDFATFEDARQSAIADLTKEKKRIEAVIESVKVIDSEHVRHIKEL